MSNHLLNILEKDYKIEDDYDVKGAKLIEGYILSGHIETFRQIGRAIFFIQFHKKFGFFNVKDYEKYTFEI